MKRFLTFLAAGAFALALTTSASAQSRSIGAGALVLDDGAGHTTTVETNSLSCNSVYILPPVCGTYNAGAVPTGVTNGELLYWNSTAGQWETIDAGANTDVLTSNGPGTAPSWLPSSGGALSGGVVNQIPVWTSATSIGNSSIKDNGTTVSTSEYVNLGDVAGNVNNFGVGAGTNQFGTNGNSNDFGGNGNGNSFGGSATLNTFGDNAGENQFGSGTNAADNDFGTGITAGGTNTFGTTSGGTNTYQGTSTFSGNITETGGTAKLLGINNSSDGITNAGAISGGTGITSSGTIIFSGLSTNGVVQTSGGTGTLGIAAVGLTSEVSGVLPIANGGTNSGTALTGSGAVMIENGTAVVQGPAGTATTVLHGNVGGTPTYGSVGLTTDVSGTLPIVNGGTNSNSALTGTGAVMIENGSGIVQGPAGTTTTLLHGNAAGTPTYGSVVLTTDVSGTLPIANGGTNSNSALTGTGAVMIENGSGIVQGPAGTTTTLLHGNAAGTPTYGSVSLTADVSGVLPIANGGSNSGTALTGTGAVMIENGTAVVQGPAGTATTVLHGNAGGTPTYGTVGLTTDVSGILPIANGGTGAATVATNNQVFAGPASGAPGAPSFRGLASTDIPNNAANTTGSATNIVTTATGTNAFYYPTFVSAATSSASTGLDVDAGISYNPSSNQLSVLGPIGSGTAGSVSGSLLLASSNGTNSTTIADNGASATVTYYLPTTAPGAADDVLQANGTASPVQLSWVPQSGGGGGTSTFTNITSAASSTTSVTFTTTGISLSVPAGKTEVISGVLYCASGASAAPGIKFEMQSSQNSNMAVYMQAREDGGANEGSGALTVTGGTTSSVLAAIGIAANTATAVQVSGYVTNTQASATTFTLYFAQNATNATATTVNATSYFTWTQY